MGSRGRSAPEDYVALLRGIRDLPGHIFGLRYTAEIASSWASKVMYAALCLERSVTFIRPVPDDSVRTTRLIHPELNQLKHLRRAEDALPFAYLCAVDRLLSA